jgi:hypothetical protein
MEKKKISSQAVTFCALALLFLGSLYYFVSVTMQNKKAIEHNAEIAGYLDTF